MLCNLHQYANIFGRPRTGIHAARIPYLDWAFTDTMLTIALAYYTYNTTARRLGYTFLMHLVFWILVGGAMHSLFGVHTSLVL